MKKATRKLMRQVAATVAFIELENAKAAHPVEAAKLTGGLYREKLQKLTNNAIRQLEEKWDRCPGKARPVLEAEWLDYLQHTQLKDPKTGKVLNAVPDAYYTAERK